jgi:hypothetical protein
LYRTQLLMNLEVEGSAGVVVDVGRPDADAGGPRVGGGQGVAGRAGVDTVLELLVAQQVVESNGLVRGITGQGNDGGASVSLQGGVGVDEDAVVHSLVGDLVLLADFVDVQEVAGLADVAGVGVGGGTEAGGQDEAVLGGRTGSSWRGSDRGRRSRRG